MSDQADSHADGSSSYTGVILVPGVGLDRLSTGESFADIMDVLVYWFNHKARLALRSEGPGRVWLNILRSFDEDPDAPADRATMEVSAPAPRGEEPRPLRLEWRSVPWIQEGRATRARGQSDLATADPRWSAALRSIEGDTHWLAAISSAHAPEW